MPAQLTVKDPVKEHEVRRAMYHLSRCGSNFMQAEDVEKIIQRLAFEREHILQVIRDIDHTTTCRVTKYKTQSLVNVIYQDV